MYLMSISYTSPLTIRFPARFLTLLRLSSLKIRLSTKSLKSSTTTIEDVASSTLSARPDTTTRLLNRPERSLRIFPSSFITSTIAIVRNRSYYSSSNNLAYLSLRRSTLKRGVVLRVSRSILRSLAKIT